MAISANEMDKHEVGYFLFYKIFCKKHILLVVTKWTTLAQNKNFFVANWMAKHENG